MTPCLRVAMLALLAAACGPAPHVAPPTAGTYVNPVATPVAADPSVVRAADGTYYLFATQDDWGDGAYLIPTFRSEDLVSWTFVGDVFDAAPGWKDEGFLWAPDVSRRGDGYVLYYSYSTWGDPNPCIGRATAARPEGPWTDLGRAVFCSDDIGVENSIDPFFWEDGGAQTLVWGSFAGIHAVELTADGTAPADAPVRLTDDRFEAAFVARRAGFYYLFLSSGSCCAGAASTYEVYVGRSASLTGPYVDRAGLDLRSGGGTRVLAGNATWVGPGHVAVVADADSIDWLFYHAIPRADPRLPNGVNRRPALIDRVAWVDGWPVVHDGAGPSTNPQAAPVIR